MVDGWAVTVAEANPLADFAGSLPAEGHVFHQLVLLVESAESVPRYLAGNMLGTFTAQWKEYRYDAIAVDSVAAYIPPRWPVRVAVTLDLPQIATEPEFALLARSGGGRFVLNSPSGEPTIRLHGTAPKVRALGDAFSANGMDASPVVSSAQAWPNDWDVSSLVRAPNGRHLAVKVSYSDTTLIFDTVTGRFDQEQPGEFAHGLAGWIP